MLRLAQCEKAVTISELMGRPQGGLWVSMGSKTPRNLSRPALVNFVTGIHGSSYLCLVGPFRCVFKGLQSEMAGQRKRLGGADPYLLDGHVDSTWSARFGPNFVTIQPTGVCACSI
jgi:hypothetical protein